MIRKEMSPTTWGMFKAFSFAMQGDFTQLFSWQQIYFP